MKSEKNKLEKEASQMKVCLQSWTGVAKSKADEVQKLETIVQKLQEDNMRMQNHVSFLPREMRMCCSCHSSRFLVTFSFQSAPIQARCFSSAHRYKRVSAKIKKQCTI